MAQRLYFPREQVFTDLGAIGAGWKLASFETQTTTPKVTYSDVDLTVPNTNPIIADSTGRFGDIFVDDLSTYKLVLTDSDDNTIWTADPVDPKTFSLNDFDPRPTSFWGTTAGTASAYTLDADPAITAYSSTQTFYFACHLDCNANPTMAISGLTALNLRKYNGGGSKVGLEAGDILAGQTYEARNDGTDIIILNPEKPIRLNIGDSGELTISSKAITISGSNHTLRSETASNPDTLDTISGGTKGQILILSLGASDEPITFESGTNNILCPNGFDATLSDVNQRARLQYDGTNWNFLDIKLPGDIVQVVNTIVGTSGSTANPIPFDNTIPQNTEGGEFMTLSITPTSSNNKLKIDVVLIGNANNTVAIAALFQDNIVNALAAACQVDDYSSENSMVTITFSYYMDADTTSLTTFKVRAGSDSTVGTNFYFNADGVGNPRFGGVSASSITITEIQA